MKYILILALFCFHCTEQNDSPTFRFDDPFFESRFNKFVEIASDHNVTVPKSNMILRFITPDVRDNLNHSQAYRKGNQLYIDIDRGFAEGYFTNDNYVTVLIYQQLANGLLGTGFRDCGIMKKIIIPEDMPTFNSLDYGDYPPLFDSEAPC